MPLDSIKPNQEPKMVEFEAVYTRPDGSRIKLVAGSEIALERMVEPLIAHAQMESALPDLSKLQADINNAIDSTTTKLLLLVSGHNALDIMSMIQQYLLPPDFGMLSEGSLTLDGTWACADVVALVLLGAGLPNNKSSDTNTAEIIPGCAHLAARIIELSNYLVDLSGVKDTDKSDSGKAIVDISHKLRTYEMLVRGRQHESIALRINEAILNHTSASTTWQNTVGFTYSDILAVRETLISLVGDRFDSAIYRLRDATQMKAELSDSTRSAFHTLFQTPSAIQLVTLDQVLSACTLEKTVVEKILDIFSIAPDGRDSHTLVNEFCAGRNPLAGKGILKVPNHGYLIMAGAISLDEVRRIIEAKIVNTPLWQKYGKGRDRAAEELVVKTFRRIFGNRGSWYTQLKYRASTQGKETADLSVSSTTASRAERLKQIFCLWLTVSHFA